MDSLTNDNNNTYWTKITKFDSFLFLFFVQFLLEYFQVQMFNVFLWKICHFPNEWNIFICSRRRITIWKHTFCPFPIYTQYIFVKFQIDRDHHSSHSCLHLIHSTKIKLLGKFPKFIDLLLLNTIRHNPLNPLSSMLFRHVFRCSLDPFVCIIDDCMAFISSNYI